MNTERKKYLPVGSLRNRDAFLADEDAGREKFLHALHKAFATDSLSPFESEFLTNFLKLSPLERWTWTAGRREACDRMMKAHTAVKVPSSKFQVPTSGGRGCQYLERDADTGKLHECGAPATHQLNKARGLLYCTNHAAFVRQSLGRAQSKLEVRALLPHEMVEAVR